MLTIPEFTWLFKAIGEHLINIIIVGTLCAIAWRSGKQ
jgi:hypothetical protein